MSRRRSAPKSVWESKIFWVNTLSAALVILESTPLLDVVSDGHEKYLALAVFVLNVILRVYFTDTPTRAGVKAGTAKRAPADDDEDGPFPVVLTPDQMRLLRRGVADELEARMKATPAPGPLDEPAFLRRGRP